MSGVNVKSEIKPLKKVLLHRPGKELLNLTPNTLEELLFDDIPFLKVAQEVEVFYLEDLMAEVLEANPELREQFLKQWIEEAGIRTDRYQKIIFDYMQENYPDAKDFVLKTMEGINLTELHTDKSNSLVDLVSESSKMVIKPMPNLYFTRDPFAMIGNGVSINRMYSETRNRETIYGEYIFAHHPMLKGTPEYYSRYNTFHIEGGDILNINDKVLAMFTQIDTDKFTIHPGIMGPLTVFEITAAGEGIKVKEVNGTLESILETYVGHPVELIPCGGGDRIAAEREQWNDGSNTLCIAPGKIVVYERNDVTNKVLRDKGLDLIIVPSAELSRGRGGPRCMSMPIERED